MNSSNFDKNTNLARVVKNLAKNSNVKSSDLRWNKLQLLSEAKELIYRRFILVECELMCLLDDAAEALMSCEENATSEKSSMVSRALRRAYDVFSAHMVQRDMAFQYVSYGGDDTEPQHISIHH